MARDLAQRAEQSVQRNGEREPFQQQLAKMQEQFQRAMPRGAEAVQLIRDVMTCMRQTPKLAECAQTEVGAQSILGAAMTCAQLGLRPGVGALGHAWILPFWDNRNRVQKAQLIIGYKGYVDLGQRSDRIGSLHSRIVYENDEFKLTYGLEKDDFDHTPYFMLGHDNHGAARLFYAIGRLANGGTAMADPMTLAEMQAHRDRFAMAKKDGRVVGPWADHFDSMGRKTLLLRLMSLMPKSTEIQRAIDNDGSVRMDLSAGEIDTPTHIDGEVIGDPVDEPIEPARESIEVSGGKPDEPSPPEDPGVQMARPAELKRLAEIRKAEKHDDASWLDYVAAATGADVTRDSDLTLEQADHIIAIFDADGGAK